MNKYGLEQNTALLNKTVFFSVLSSFMGIQRYIGYSIHPQNISALNYYSPHKAENDRCVSDVCSP